MAPSIVCVFSVIVLGIVLNQILRQRGAIAISRASGSEKNRTPLIFVLAHFLDEDYLSREYEERCKAALKLYQLSPRPIMVAGGTTKGSSVSQAEAAKRWFLEHGVPEDMIIFPSTSNWMNDSHDTLVECRLLAAEMQRRNWKSCVFVTNKLQAIQVHFALRRFGVTGYPHCTDLKISSLKYRLIRWAIILPTLIDPNGRMFWILRFFRREISGSRI